MSAAPLTIVIPTLNAATQLPGCLAALTPGRQRDLIGEVLVVDGGSDDGTREAATAAGCRFLEAPRGRGSQLCAGAGEAAGAFLLFLHADTRLGDGWAKEAEAFMDATGPAGERAAFFKLAFDEPGESARRTAGLANWRARSLGLPYGDQGLLIPKAFYEALGGHPDEPLMEDVALVRKIGRKRLTAFESWAVTSAERYRKGGWLKTALRNLALLTLYYLGATPRWLARHYR
ncbi:MAG: TIGR04283 family arsenosugar biosynthesis glycosyltransferase [Limibacillus sp.]